MQNQPPLTPRRFSVTSTAGLTVAHISVRGDMITVMALGQSETTQIGHMPVEDLARHILSGIVRLWTHKPV